MNKKIEKKKCQNFATVRRFWPGKEPDLVCMSHAADSQRILQAMGTHLHLEALVYLFAEALPDKLPPCSCYEGFSQTISMKMTDEGK